VLSGSPGRVADRGEEVNRRQRASSRSGARSGQRDRRRSADEDQSEPTLPEDCWITYGTQVMWVVGYADGGAPYGLQVLEFERAELATMGLDVDALDAAGMLERQHSTYREPREWPLDEELLF
jgi:hypothetical protein